MGGRPPKYKNGTKLMHFALPVEVYDLLKKMSEETGLSMTELVANAVLSCNKEMLKKITKDMNNMREHLKEVSKEYKKVSEDYARLSNKYAKLVEKTSKTTLEMVYEDVKEDSTVNEFLEHAKKNHAEWIRRGMNENQLLEQFEVWLYENKRKTLKHKTILKTIFKSWLKQVKRSVM